MYLKSMLRLLGKAGYHMASAYLQAAIDALVEESKSDAELSSIDFERDERVRLILEAIAEMEAVKDDRENEQGE